MQLRAGTLDNGTRAKSGGRIRNGMHSFGHTTIVQTTCNDELCNCEKGWTLLTARRPSPEDEFAMACIHSGMHSLYSLAQASDEEPSQRSGNHHRPWTHGAGNAKRFSVASRSARFAGRRAFMTLCQGPSRLPLLSPSTGFASLSTRSA